ncbi:MAG: S8 family serine peptidase [Elusimicrobia bacterium]|nr:S8 family serine peptidase [Elusimicrobiota bacterium]
MNLLTTIILTSALTGAKSAAQELSQWAPLPLAAALTPLCTQHVYPAEAYILSSLNNREKTVMFENFGVPPYLYFEAPAGRVQSENPYNISSSATISSTADKLLEVLSGINDDLDKIDMREFRLIYNDISEWNQLENTCRAYPDVPSPGFYVGQIAALLTSLRRRIAEAIRDDASDSFATLGRTDNFTDHLTSLRSELREQKRDLFWDGIFSGGNSETTQRLDDSIQALTRIIDGSGPALTPRGLLAVVQSVPEDRLTDAGWALLARHFPSGEDILRHEAMDAWRQGITGEGVRIAIIDTGIDAAHPSIQGSVVAENNFTNSRYRSGDRLGQSDNRGSHGTYVTATALALAPEAEIINIKVMTLSPTDSVPPELALTNEQFQQAVIAGIDEAIRQGASIINMSFKSVLANGAAPVWSAINEKIQDAISHGVTVIVAAANEGARSATDNFQNGTFNAYAAPLEAIAVGAVDYFDRIAPLSSYSQIIDPATHQTYYKPDVTSYGISVRVPTTNTTSIYSGDENNLYATNEGTSLSTPQVSAIAALAIQRAHDLNYTPTPAMIRRWIIETAIEPEDCAEEESCQELGYGYGIVSLPGVLARAAADAALLATPARPYSWPRLY